METHPPWTWWTSMQSSRLWASVRFSQVLWTVLPRNLPSVGLQQLMASHKTSWDALPGLTHGVVTFHRLGSSIQLRMDGGTHRLAVLTSSAFVGIFFFTNVPGPGLEKAQGGGGGDCVVRSSLLSSVRRAAGPSGPFHPQVLPWRSLHGQWGQLPREFLLVFPQPTAPLGARLPAPFPPAAHWHFKEMSPKSQA